MSTGRLLHLASNGPLKERHVLVPDLAPAPTVAARVLTAYQKAAKAFPRNAARKRDLWDWITSNDQFDFLSVLATNDVSRLDTYLRGMFRHDATHGTCQGRVEYDRFTKDPGALAKRLMEYKDKIVCLSELVGARRVENPEITVSSGAIYTPMDVLVAEIQSVIGISIRPPDVDGGLFKLAATGGSYHERDLYALGTAWSLACQFGRDVRICEIGGGVGKGAYWWNQLRPKTPGSSYTILDLPHINVLQGYHLIRAGVRCALYGEPADATTEVIVTPHRAKDKVEKNFQIVLNQDSFPEMTHEDVLDYLAWMKRAGASHLYSVNHESMHPTPYGKHLNVPEIARTAGLTRLTRNPYWMRSGYVAETYKI